MKVKTKRNEHNRNRVRYALSLSSNVRQRTVVLKPKLYTDNALKTYYLCSEKLKTVRRKL